MSRQRSFNWKVSRRTGVEISARRRLVLEGLESRKLLAVDVTGLSPADDATAVLAGDNLVMTFSEDVLPGPGAGFILIKNADDHSVIEGINVNSDRVTFDGATVTIDPTADLPADTNIYVEISPAAFQDTLSAAGNAVIFSEDFERLPMLDSPLALDGEFNPGADANQYALTFTGTLVVMEAGEYTFGGNSDDGMWLLLDLNQNGDVLDFADEVIIDQTTHGNQDRLSTCGIESGVQACVGAGTESYFFEEGEYLFQYGYFEQGGGSSGEFFYAKGTLEAFDPNAFVLIGDDSQGIGVGEDGITATTYKAEDGTTVTYFVARDMVDGFLSPAAGFPVSAPVDFADAWNTGGQGRFGINNPVPGVPETDEGEGTDWSDQVPFGWAKENPAPHPEGGQPEFDGWIPMDKNWWINQQGNQERTDFELGQGVVAVADPDAYDDFDIDIDVDGGLFHALFTTPEIDLTGVAAGSAVLNFDSSFRAEPTQIAVAEVSFDGGATWEEILRYDGAVETDRAHTNEALSFPLNNPAGGTMLARWSLLQASNDWWWAIDNVVVTADVATNVYEGIADPTVWNFDTFAGTGGLESDFNQDGMVDLSDFNILKANFGQSGATMADGDANADGTVDLSDFNILKSQFGQSAAIAASIASSRADAAFADYGSGDDDEDEELLALGTNLDLL